ncbi:TPA: hypothetical protein MYO65_005135 [Citrobacter braakii]|nr:hypothetical protein [Citrobacter braakii]HCB1480279.1 hypothetical protein [Citrobacter braakii]HCB1689647.1 hypothetical protein [Citrobacter braakii]HCB1705731.1 hypothetical protein [Citrobacter braakii]HCB1722370.1 hypothetical protein [Citrobacter braakii]
MRIVIKAFATMLLLLLLVVNFQYNYLHVASFNQFSTIKDGSEALVLGKIFADVVEKNTLKSNVGFIQKYSITKDHDVLAVYKRIEYPQGIVTASVSDQYWNKGFSRNANKFIVDRASGIKVGYEKREFYIGQILIMPGGKPSTVTSVELGEQFITVMYSGPFFNASEIEEPGQIELTDHDYDYLPYYQQYGIQGVILSFLYQTFDFFKTIDNLQLLFSILLSIVFLLIAEELRKSFSLLFNLCFIVSMMFSPQIVGFARNLYWATFLWFWPMYFALLSYRFKARPLIQTMLMFFFMVSVVLKCLAGYEYIPCLLIVSVFIYFIAPFMPGNNYSIRDAVIAVSKFIAFALLGFAIAVLIHISMRADTLAEGLHETLGFDAIKYLPISTDGNPQNKISVFAVLNNYVFNWQQPFIYPFTSLTLFAWTCLATLISLIFIKFFDSNLFLRDAMLLITTILVPLSWYVIMAGHAKIHAYLDFVLWYIGFVPAMFFVILHATSVFINKFILMKLKCYF